MEVHPPTGSRTCHTGCSHSLGTVTSPSGGLPSALGIVHGSRLHPGPPRAVPKSPPHGWVWLCTEEEGASCKGLCVAIRGSCGTLAAGPSGPSQGTKTKDKTEHTPRKQVTEAQTPAQSHCQGHGTVPQSPGLCLKAQRPLPSPPRSSRSSFRNLCGGRFTCEPSTQVATHVNM